MKKRYCKTCADRFIWKFSTGDQSQWKNGPPAYCDGCRGFRVCQTFTVNSGCPVSDRNTDDDDKVTISSIFDSDVFSDLDFD